MYRLHNLENERQENNHNNLSGKATVKKQLSNRLMRFNQIGDKQNEYSQSNLLINLNKNTVRKQIEQNEEIEAQGCANHLDRKSEYLVKIQGEILKYCRKCATHIASQGFDVQKIGQVNKNIRLPNNGSGEILLPNISPSRGRQSNSTKDRIEKEKRNQLLTLVKSLKSLRDDYRQKEENLTEISESFSSEKEMLNSYYDELVSYIEEIREIHFQAIDESAINTVQVCEIEKGEINETLGEIEEMVADIEFNFENIITKVDEQNYAQCFQFYKQKECIFSHRLEELGSEAKTWPCSSEDDINLKIQSFKDFVNELHEVGDQLNQDQEERQSQYY